MIRIAIAEDHELFANLLARSLSEEPNFNIVIKANNGKELIDSMEQTAVDVILLDLDMPILDGDGALKIIRERFNESIKVIILSMHYDEFIIQRYLELGANACLPKETDYDILVEGIEEVHACGTFLHENLSLSFTKRILDSERTQFNIKTGDQLTDRENLILSLLGKNKSSIQTAQQLYRSARTIDNHLYRIKKKLGIENDEDLMEFVIKNFDA